MEPERVRLLINVEAQNEDRPGYDISLRVLLQEGSLITLSKKRPVLRCK